MTPDELRSRLTITVEEAAAALGIGRTAAYEAVRRGELETLRLGRRVLVPTAPLLRLLGLEDRPGTEDPAVTDDEPPRNRRCDADQAGAGPVDRSGAQVVELRG
jgi:excisionase family DNA binding protein